MRTVRRREAGPGRRAVHRGDPADGRLLGAPALTADVMRTDLVPGETVYRTVISSTATLGRLRLRGPGRPGDQAQRGTHLARRVERRHAQPGRRLRRRLCGLRQRRGARHRRLRGDRGSVTALELRQGARDRLPDTMLPDRIDLVDALPLTAASKLDERRLLSEAGLRGPAPPAGHARRLSPTVKA